MLQFFLSSSLPFQLPSIHPPCPHCTRHCVSVIPNLPSRLQIQNNTLEFIDVQNPGASRHIQMSACLFQVRDVLWPQKSKDCYDPVPSKKQVQTQEIVGLTVIFPLLITFFFFFHTADTLFQGGTVCKNFVSWAVFLSWGNMLYSCDKVIYTNCNKCYSFHRLWLQHPHNG